MWSSQGLTQEAALKYLEELEMLPENESGGESEEDDDTLIDDKNVELIIKKFSEQSSSSENDVIADQSISNVPSTSDILEENVTQRRMRKNFVTLPVGSKQTSKAGHAWEVIAPSSPSSGRALTRNIMRDNPGPTLYAKRNVSVDSLVSAFRLFVDNSMLKHIQKCTETEARSRLQDDNWSISLQELDAFIAILLARGAYGAKTLDLAGLWSTVWGPAFFRDNVT